MLREAMNDTVPDNDNDVSSSCEESSSSKSSSSVDYEPEYEWEEISIPGVFALQNEYDDDNNDDNENDLFSLHVLTVVPPPIEYMSQLHSQQQEISGRQVWTGSLFLAHVLFHYESERKLLLLSCQHHPKRILELGSGTGVLGMALYKFLSLQCNNNNNNDSSNQDHRQNHHYPIVTLTDGDIKAVELLQQNLNHVDNRNALHLPDHSHDDEKYKQYCGGCKATCLQWGVPESLNQFDDWCRDCFVPTTPCTSRSSPNRSSSTNPGTGQAADNVEAELPPPLPFVFDVIVAGDVLYKPDLPQIFFDTVRQLLLRRRRRLYQEQEQQTDIDNNNNQQSNSSDSGSDGILWLCHVPRSTVTHELVLQTAHQTGFIVEQTISLDSLTKATGNSNSKRSSMEKLLAACPLEDVTRARVYRMVLQKA